MKFNKKWIVLFSTFISVFLIGIYHSIFYQTEWVQAVESNTKNKAPYLTCPVVRERVHDFLRYHYVFRNFNDEISSRTFIMYFKMLDPGKLYFTQSDINQFLPQEKKLGEKIDSVDCQFVLQVYELYKKRVQEATATITKVLQSPFDFTVKESIETDRKKINWAQSPEELKERWRKSIKFIVLNMKDTQPEKKIAERLQKRYNSFLKNTLNRSNDDIHAIFLNAFALSLDPHSSFLTPTDNAQFQIDFSLKLVGIGATLMSPDGFTTIDAVVPGGAASKDGRLKKGDKIIAVDSGDGTGMQDVIDMDLDKVVQLIRGKEGTVVKLLIMRKLPSGEVKRIPIELVRSIVQIKDSEAKSDVLNLGNKKVGIINLPSFYIDYRDCQENPTTCRSSANDMAREVKKLMAQKVDGILIDLRRNGGGDLSEVQKMVGIFIDNPVVTQVEDRDHQVRSLDSDAQAIYRGPLAILVSKYTASASEILSGAVQDYGRGLILGDSRTFGKGTVQTVMEIPGTSGRQTNGAIHVTIAKFFRPSGKSNQEKGILSDVVIPDLLDATETGEKEADYALPYTTIKPARDFAAEQNLSSIAPKLQQMSSARVEKDERFKDIIEAENKAKNDKNTLVTLTEESLKNLTKKKNDKKKKANEDDDLPDFTLKVIEPKDYMLQEASQILVDGIQLLSPKLDWTASNTP